MSELKGKNAIVTGGTKGIGRAIACRLAKEGANLIIVSRHLQDCEEIAKELRDGYGIKAKGVAISVSSSEAAKKLVEEAVSFFDVIDIVVNNAGTAITKKLELTTEADWDLVLDTNLKGPFFLSLEAGKAMMQAGGGSIINIASAMGLTVSKGILPYCVSKAALIHMTKALANEWAKKNIRVNAVCPGYVVTDLNREEMNKSQVRDTLLSKTPMGRFGTAEEIADGVVFLASSESSYMTGQNLVLDGGRILV